MKSHYTNKIKTKISTNHKRPIKLKTHLDQTQTNLSSKVFKYGGEIHRCASTNPLRVLASLKKSSDPTYRKLEPCFMRSRYRLGGLWFAPASLRRTSFFRTHFPRSTVESQNPNPRTDNKSRASKRGVRGTERVSGFC